MCNDCVCHDCDDRADCDRCHSCNDGDMNTSNCKVKDRTQLFQCDCCGDYDYKDYCTTCGARLIKC